MARGPYLTKRERAFILLVCRTPEPTRAEIASRWGVAEKTVETHRANVYRKLAVHSRLELYLKAVALGVVPCACGLTSAAS